MTKKEIEEYVKNCPYSDKSIDTMHTCGLEFHYKKICPSKECICARRFYSDELAIAWFKDRIKEMPMSDERNMYYVVAVSALESRERDRWIPCSDRMPEGECDVLVTDKFGEVAHAVYLHWDGDWCFVSAEEYMMLEDVKAWKLIPEPYKE